MDEREHVDYAEEGWKCVDEALRRGGDRLRYWTADQRCGGPHQGAFPFAYPEKKNTLLIMLFARFRRCRRHGGRCRAEKDLTWV